MWKMKKRDQRATQIQDTKTLNVKIRIRVWDVIPELTWQVEAQRQSFEESKAI